MSGRKPEKRRVLPKVVGIAVGVRRRFRTGGRGLIRIGGQARGGQHKQQTFFGGLLLFLWQEKMGMGCGSARLRK